jgi:hypothetical protein
VPSELTLSLWIGGLNPAPRSVMEAITEVSVRVNADASAPSGFDIKLATSKASEITTQLLPSGYFDPPTRVIIAATLQGFTTVLMDGVITQHEVVPSDEATKSMLSLKGEDLTRMMDLIDLTGFPFPAMPDFVRVDLMLLPYLALYQVVPLVIPSVLLDVSDPLEHIPVQQGTHRSYIKQLAERVGYTFFLQPGPDPGMSIAYWGPKLRIPIPFLTEAPPLAIDFDGSSNVESLQFSFDGFKKTLFVVLIQPDGLPIPIPIPVPDVTPLSPPLGQKDPPLLKVSPLTGLAKYNPIEAAAIALAKASDAANIITGSGTLDVMRYGSILNARTMATVQGAGITYDGQYFVDSVTHTIKPGSYKQSFTLLRNRLIAASSFPGADRLEGSLSPVQQLSGFAPTVTSAVAPTLPGASLLPGIPQPGSPPPLPGASLLPGIPQPGPPLPIPGSASGPGQGRVLSSLPASPAP